MHCIKNYVAQLPKEIWIKNTPQEIRTVEKGRNSPNQFLFLQNSWGKVTQMEKFDLKRKAKVLLRFPIMKLTFKHNWKHEHKNEKRWLIKSTQNPKMMTKSLLEATDNSTMC